MLLTRKSDFRLLAAFRRSLRVLNRAVEEGARSAQLTVPQQGFLLALRAAETERVSLGFLREELGMDDATAAELVGRLVRARLVRRHIGRDRRAADISLTTHGSARLLRSMRGIRRRIQRAAKDGELETLRRDAAAYLAFYGRGRARP